jgi:hypothetical protein
MQAFYSGQALKSPTPNQGYWQWSRWLAICMNLLDARKKQNCWQRDNSERQKTRDSGTFEMFWHEGHAGH